MGLSELQSKILHRDDLAQAWASRTDILNVFEVAFTGCMTVFSCLEAETRNLKQRNPTVLAKLPGVLARLKFIWNQDRLKELLEALRGQQTSITFLLNILEMDTLSNIQKDIRKHTHKIEATAAEAQSLQSRIPSIKIESQSIFDKDASRLSLFEATSNFAPSELDFQFDDLVINSNAYRRAFAKAHAENQESYKQIEGRDVNIDPATPRGLKFDESTTRPKDTPLGTSQILVCDAVEGPAEEGALSPEGQTESLEEATKEGKHQIVNLNSSSSQDLNSSQTVSQLVCNKCLLDITGRSVTALGYAWHPDCFQCYDCGEPLAGHFFPSKEQGKEHKPLCEKDYILRLESKCFKCDEALGGTYITTSRDHALEYSHQEQAYHPQHFTCDECDTILSINSYHAYEKGVYCELHFCRNFANYCSGCGFPILRCSYLRQPDEAGGYSRWHLACFSMTQDWGLQIPVTDKGRKYLATIQTGSIRDLIPDTREKHIDCLQHIYHFGSHILSTVMENFRLALEFRQKFSSGYGPFKYWSNMLFEISRLFQAVAQLSNDVSDAEIRAFSRTFHVVLADLDLESNDSSYVAAERILAALKSVLKVALSTLLEMDHVSWDAMPTEVDDFLMRLNPDTPLVSHPNYNRLPTGCEVFLRCEECNETLLHDVVTEASEAGHRWHPECFRCLVCGSSEGVVSPPSLQAAGSYKCQLESCG